jgi:chromosome partitioning protein
MSQARIASFINYKGGVGKTTTTYHIGCSLAEHHGKRVLLVDIDPQSNLSLLCMDYDRYDQHRKQQGTIRDLYRRFRQENRLGIRDFIVPTPIRLDRGPLENLDLLPCDIDMLGEDLGGVLPTVSSARGANAFQILEQVAGRVLHEWRFLQLALDEVREEYDDILIDCPPNLYLMTQNALVASDRYLVTVVPEHLSAIGGLDPRPKGARHSGPHLSGRRRCWAGNQLCSVCWYYSRQDAESRSTSGCPQPIASGVGI